MIDVQKETDRLVREFVEKLEAIGAMFSARSQAVAWDMAAKTIAAGLNAIVVGSLTWQDKGTPAKEAKLAMSVPRKRPNPPRQKPQPRVSGHKVSILGPQPEARAKHYRELLEKRSGAWSRRDGKVSYTCLGPIGSPGKNGAAFYLMRRRGNGEEKKIKFASICSDWRYIPYP